LHMEVKRMETTEFKDVRFMTAADKKKVLRQWVRFLKSGFDARLFMKSLYHHLIQHCSFIAITTRAGSMGSTSRIPRLLSGSWISSTGPRAV